MMGIDGCRFEVYHKAREGNNYSQAVFGIWWKSVMLMKRRFRMNEWNLAMKEWHDKESSRCRRKEVEIVSDG